MRGTEKAFTVRDTFRSGRQVETGFRTAEEAVEVFFTARDLAGMIVRCEVFYGDDANRIRVATWGAGIGGVDHRAVS